MCNQHTLFDIQQCAPYLKLIPELISSKKNTMGDSRVIIYPQSNGCVSDFHKGTCVRRSLLPTVERDGLHVEISRLVASLVRATNSLIPLFRTCRTNHSAPRAAKYEREARKHWDVFYKRNGDRVRVGTGITTVYLILWCSAQLIWPSESVPLDWKSKSLR